MIAFIVISTFRITEDYFYLYTDTVVSDDSQQSESKDKHEGHTPTSGPMQCLNCYLYVVRISVEATKKKSNTLARNMAIVCPKHVSSIEKETAQGY